MRITNLECERTDRGDELSGQLGAFRYTLKLPPGAARNTTGDAFLAAGLLAAMARGEPLELDPAFSASPTLLRGLAQIQQVFSTWVPRLRPVPLVAREAAPPSPRPHAATLFSGGADSLFTLLERGEEISHALHIRGFDYRRERRELAAEIDERNRAFLEDRGTELLVVESNLRDLYDDLGVHVFVWHGCHLASVGLALGFERTFVPSSFTWADLLPWGTHPVTDPLWGNGAVEFIHHGLDSGRIDKLRRIGTDPGALGLLRVCPGFTRYSCGVCEKCLRTRVALRLLGLRSPNLDALESPWPVARLWVDSERSRVNWSENWHLARERGDRALEWAVATALARYEMRRTVRRVDQLLLGGAVAGGVRGLKRLLGRGEGPSSEIRIDEDS